MLAHRYTIWGDAWGDDETPDEDNEKRWVGITALAKRDRHTPYEVFNELVSARLGQLIGLPIPVGMVVERDKCVYFCSCHIGAAGGELPEADFDRFVREQPENACGLMTFDAWIANDDRHNSNLWYNYYEKQYFAFDQGRALFGTSGSSRLREKAETLAVRGPDELSLAHYIGRFESFQKWHGRIIPITAKSGWIFVMLPPFRPF